MSTAKRDDGREQFVRRIREWAMRLDVRVQAVTIRKMRRKWASCSTAGRLTFDDSFLSKSGDLQNYVIVHELLHLSVPNHGRLWKILMRAHLGDYEKFEKELTAKAPKPSRIVARGDGQSNFDTRPDRETRAAST